jgi:hypothetical protein
MRLPSLNTTFSWTTKTRQQIKPELVNAALQGEVALPERAVGGTTSHRAKQVLADFNDLLDSAGS